MMVHTTMKSVILFLVLLYAAPAAALTSGDDRCVMTTDRFLRGKAMSDECYRGLGNNQPFLYPDPTCDNLAGAPKVNQGYVWALADTVDEVWFGTVANPQCLTAGVFGGEPQPYDTGYWACEFGAGPFPQLPVGIGDFRAPQIFVYTKSSQAITEVTPPGPITEANPWGIHPLVIQTSGFRAAGQRGDLILLAGNALRGGVNLFAFNSVDNTFLGTEELEEYNNIRNFLSYGGMLYSPMGNASGDGSVLKWSGTIEDPFRFEKVGSLPVGGASIAEHEGRLFVMTWPSKDAAGAMPGVLASLEMSPPVPDGGLTESHSDDWVSVWDVSRYEPDPLIAEAYGGGALKSYGGYLFFGTMHVPFIASGLFIDRYGIPESDDQRLDAIIGTFRTASIFRGRNFDGQDPEIELLYGNPRLPVYTPPPDNGTDEGTWQMEPNNTGNPRFGAAGFGNPWNNYTWSMEVWDDRLWVGMMDWSFMAAVRGNEFADNAGTAIAPRLFEHQEFGGDLFYFPCPACPAFPESTTGVGNFTNYGIRTMARGEDSLFLGMANPMNLLTDPDDDLPEGGWELIELEKRTSNTPSGDNATVTLDNGVTVTFYSVTRPGMTVAKIVENPYYTYRFEVASILLDAYFPDMPEGMQADEVLHLYSSADFNNGGNGARPLGTVCVPEGGPCTTGLYQLEYDSELARYAWKDITISTSDNETCGEIAAPFFGILAVLHTACPDDGLFCNGREVCRDGICQSTGFPCGELMCDEALSLCIECLSDTDCDDANACTVDVCGTGGLCRNISIAGCVPCSVNADCPSGEVCSLGVCTAAHSGGGGPALSVPNTVNIDSKTTQFAFAIGVAGAADATLNWSIGAVAYDPAGTPWIGGIEPLSGKATAAKSSTASVTVTAAGLEPGAYAAFIPVTSNAGNATIKVLLTVSPTTDPVKPPPECASDADCDDGIFCNGMEACDGGVCAAGEPPCDDSEICFEQIKMCLHPNLIRAFSLQKKLFRPKIRTSRCTWVILKTGMATNFESAISSIALKGPYEGADGVSIDSARQVKEIGGFIMVPLCTQKTATLGNWQLEIATLIDDGENPFVENIQYGFEIR